MTCDVDIEACEREVTKLTIVIEEDAVNGMVKGWHEKVEVGSGVKPGARCGHESWMCNDWEREMDEEEEEEVEKRIENTGLKKWEGD